MKRARNQRFALRFAGLGTGNSDAIDFKRASDGALVVGFGLLEICQSAYVLDLRIDQVALRVNDEVNGGRVELVFFLLGIKRLLLQLAGFAGGLDLSAALSERDVGVADVEQRRVLELLQLGLELTLRKDGALIVRLRGTISQGDLHVQRDLIIWKIVMKSGGHGVAEAGLGDSGHRRDLRSHEFIRDGGPVGIHNLDTGRDKSGSPCSEDGLVTRETNRSVLRAQRSSWQQGIPRPIYVDLSIQQVERFFLQFRPLRKGFLY